MQTQQKVTTALSMTLLVAGAVLYGAAGAADVAPARFSNGDAAALERLRPLSKLERGPYETSGDFTKRLCSETYKLLKVDGKSAIALGVEHGKYSTSFNYDPDRRSFVVKLGTTSHYIEDRAKIEDEWRWSHPVKIVDFDSIEIGTQYKEQPKGYTGSNAFGVSRDVIVATEDRAVVLLPNPVMSYRRHKIALPAKPDEAKRLDGDLRLAILTRIQSPCVVVGRAHVSPTLNYLYDITKFEIGLVGSKDAEWIIYRASSGEVMRRGKFSAR